MSAEENDGEESSGGGGCPAWMATFGDMMSLLLCFFVLLLSFANMDIVKFRDMAGSLENAFGVQRNDPGPMEASSPTVVELESAPVAEPPSEEPEPPAPSQDEWLLEQIEEVIEERNLHDMTEAFVGERGVTVRVKGALMFETGSDGLRGEAMPILFEIAELTKNSDYLISVEGHTDDVPISTAQFPSNWHLSAARAVAGLRFLVDAGGVPPERASATGRAHTRPVVRGTSADARGRNRRLEFVFYRDEVGGEQSGDESASAGRRTIEEAMEQTGELLRKR